MECESKVFVVITGRLTTAPSELPLANTHTYPRLTWRKSSTHGEKVALQRKMNNL